MPTMAGAELPTLPEELAREIVHLLSCRDVCNASLACKAFWEWGNTLAFIEASTTMPSQEMMANLLRFQARRAPLGLKVPELCLDS